MWHLGYVSGDGTTHSGDAKILHPNHLRSIVLSGSAEALRNGIIKAGTPICCQELEKGRHVHFAPKGHWYRIERDLPKHKQLEADLKKMGRIYKIIYNKGSEEVLVLGLWNDSNRFPYFDEMKTINQGIIEFEEIDLMYFF